MGRSLTIHGLVFIFCCLLKIPKLCDADSSSAVPWDDAATRISLPDVVTLEKGSSKNISINANVPVNETIVFALNITYSSMNVTIVHFPDQIVLSAKSDHSFFTVEAVEVGQVTSYLLSNNSHKTWQRVRFLVIHSFTVEVLEQIIGWIYFLAWSVSFYPQVFENWRRKRYQLVT